jgi:hypothetical protein
MSRNRLSSRFSSRVGSRFYTSNVRPESKNFVFSSKLYNNASTSQSLMMKNFETMINGSSPKYYLKQSHFSEGTLKNN